MLTELKRETFEANRALPRNGLINLTFGNASAIDRRKGIFAIKPSGVAYEALRPADMVLIDLEGNKVEGRLNPSSDTPTHRRLYLGFGSIAAIVHTHSTHATAFSQAGRPIPCLGTTHADYFGGEVPVTRSLRKAEIIGDYEWKTGDVILERFRTAPMDPLDFPGVLVRGHGPFAWGVTAAKAVENAVAIECAAEMALLTLQLDPSARTIDRALHDRHFQRKHGPTAYYGQGKR